MRKMIMAVLAASVLVPATMAPIAAQAQSAREVRESQRELRRDQGDLRRDRQDLREARRYGDRGDVREARGELRDSRRDVRGSRREVREDWRDYRRTHRNEYRRPAYAGPRGYAYRPIAIGHRFERSYYGTRYQVNDYRRYRLSAPGRNARWVRYGNDVVLVNVNNGRVLQVHNGFFW